MKAFLKKNIKKTMSAFLYLADSAKPEPVDNHTIRIIWQNSRDDSARFIQDNLEHALVLMERKDIWSHCYNKAPKEGLVLEFGVYKARSTNFFADLMLADNDKRTLHGFDSFEGIEEDWVGHFRPKHGYNLDKKLPPVRDNIELIAGWVEDTVPPFLTEHKEKIAFMHIDTDTYTPCKFLLGNLHARFDVGTIILFDELHSYPGWKQGELKALQEFTQAHPNIKYNYFAFARNQAAIVITDVD